MDHPSNVIVFYTKEKYLIVRGHCMIFEKQLLEVKLLSCKRLKITTFDK